MVCIGGGGDRESHQRFGQFSGRGKPLKFGPFIFPSFLPIHPLLLSLSNRFFPLRLTNVACQILFGSYPVIQIITWHFGCICRGAAAFMQRLKSNSRQLWPWARTWPQCTQLLVTSPPTLSFGLVSCVRIKWHNNGARPRCLGEEKASAKVIGVKKEKKKKLLSGTVSPTE